MTDDPKTVGAVMVPDLCRLHQRLLVSQAGYSQADPWRALILISQLALFQAATADPAFHKRVGGDLARTSEVGCLACFKPDAFGEIVEAAKSRELGAIKKLGESFLTRGA